MQIRAYNQPCQLVTEAYYRGVLQSTTLTSTPGSYVRTGTSAGLVRGDHIKPNAWSWSWEEYELSRGTYQYWEDLQRVYSTKYTGTGFPNYGFSVRVGNVPGCIPSSPYNKALSKLYESLRSDVDLSIDIYQGGQSLRMLKDFSQSISHPVRTLANAMSSLVSSGKISKGSSFISNKWLEWQYGIRPSINTIDELLGDLKAVTMDADGFLVAKARASNAFDQTYQGVHGPSNATLPYTVTTRAKHSCEIGIRYGIANAQVNALSQFTSLNPVSFLYENIPYSFVVDWVYDIGGYLRCMETAMMTGLELKSGYVSNLVHVDNTGVSKSGRYDNYNRYHQVDLKAQSRYATFSRSVLTSLPRPAAPCLNLHLGSQRLFSAASLLRGLIKH